MAKYLKHKMKLQYFVLTITTFLFDLTMLVG